MASPIRSAAQRPKALSVVAQVLGGAVVVGVGHLVRARHERLERHPRLGDAGDGQRALRGAVVGDRPADHLVLARLADQLPVLLGQLPGRLDGLAATGGEEDPVEVARGGLGQPLGQLDRLGVRVGPQREERQVLGLLGGRLGQLGPTVPDLDDEQPGQAVEVAPAPVVVDVGALAPDDDGHLAAVLVRRVPGEVHPEVVAGGVGVARAQRRAAPVRVVGHQVLRGGHRVPQL